MEERNQNRKKSADGRRKRTTTYEDLKKKSANDDCEFVTVPEYLVGYVIGRKGSTIKQIQEQSGARIISQTKSQNEPVGFMVHGNREERACAKELINAKLAEVHPQTNRKHTSPGQVVKVPRQFKKVVNGPGGDNLRNVSTLSGADVTGDGGHALYLTGAKKKVQHAEYLIRNKVTSIRVRSNRIRVYIDERNLPEDCELQLVPLEGKDKMILPGARSQYRLKPADGYDLGPQGASKPHNSYDDSVRKEALSSLREIKEEIDSGSYHKADFWCHFGTLVIRDPDEADVEEIWTIAEAAKKLQAREKKRNEWFVAFKEGVDLNHEVIKETFGEKIEEDFMTRYDLSFVSPRSQAIRCKVWVARKGIQKNLEDIPIPFSDVKNVVEELRFEDERTRERCRGWLVLQSKKFLQANIVCPGCEVDSRISIRALTDDVVAKANGVHEKEETHLFSGYLSKLKFTDDDGLIIPSDAQLPQGYLFSHWRRSHRTLYTPRVGFSMIVSKERSWSRDYKETDTRETTDIHLHSEEWDHLLSGKDWEPEMIVAKLPEFLQFVRDVHVFICDGFKNEHACSMT